MVAPLRDWEWSAVTVEIGAQLLAAEPDQPLRVEQIARELQQPERSVRGVLDRLNGGRLVTRARLQTGEPGRPAWGYWLTDEQRPAAQRAVDTPEVLRKSHRKRGAKPGQDDLALPRVTASASSGSPDTPPAERRAVAADGSSLDRTQPAPLHEVVIVDVSGSAYAHLLEALSGTRKAEPATWAARVGDEVVFLFESDNAASAAGDLVAVLAGARLSVRSSPVREVVPATELIARAQRIAPEIRRARSTRDAHDAPQ
jgi:predicted transcriptional regulator